MTKKEDMKQDKKMIEKEGKKMMKAKEMKKKKK